MDNSPLHGMIGGLAYHHHSHDRRDCGDSRRDCAEPLASLAVDGIQKLLHEVPETRNAISDKIHFAMAQENGNSHAIEALICGTQKEVLQTRYEIAKELNCELNVLKLMQNNFERSVDKQFCEVKEEIKESREAVLKQLALDKLDEKNDEIARLRARVDRNESDIFIGSRIAELTALINSTHQEQRFASKTVQFGTGNLAGTAQTAAQNNA